MTDKFNCSKCGHTIEEGSTYVMVDGSPYHPFCRPKEHIKNAARAAMLLAGALAACAGPSVEKSYYGSLEPVDQEQYQQCVMSQHRLGRLVDAMGRELDECRRKK